MGNETSPVGFEVASDQLAFLQQLAARNDRPLDELLAEAVERYVEWRRDFDEGIERGLADARAGRVVSHEDMLAHRAAHRRKSFRA